MKIANQYNRTWAWDIGLFLLLVWGLAFSQQVKANETTTTMENMIVFGSDGDGVPDDADLCPNTPIGTPVNAFGCPASIECNWANTFITLTAMENSPSVTQQTTFVLTDSLGEIVQMSTSASFNGLEFEKTYMIVAISFENDGSLQNLQNGQNLANVSASCIDFSDAILIKTCEPNLPPTIEDAGYSIAYDAPNFTTLGTLSFDDPESKPVAITIISGNTAGIFGIDNNGTLTIVDNLNLSPSSTYILQVEITDSENLKDQATVIINTTALPVINDEDNDGVPNESDLCLGTPPGVVVNAYGCPLSVACTFEKDSVSYTASPVTNLSRTNVVYILTDSVGTILNFQTTGFEFKNLLSPKTYMLLAVAFDEVEGISGLIIGNSLEDLSSACIAISQASVFKACPKPDNDKDGVDNANDLCPNTPANTPVNDFGCPVEKDECDFVIPDIKINAVFPSTDPNLTTKYLLADANGMIVQISSKPSFFGLREEAVYMVVAFSYNGDLNSTNLGLGKSLAEVSPDFSDFSDALAIKVCPEEIQCSYNEGVDISLNVTSANTNSGTTVTTFVLTDVNGVIMDISSDPIFDNSLVSEGYYSAIAFSYEDDQSIENLELGNYSWEVTANCLDQSDPITLKICPCFGKIGDVAFFDYDANGVKNENEPGWAEVEIILLKNGIPYDTTITDREGKYLFDSLSAGMYQVYVDSTQLPYAYDFIQSFQGGDTLNDSNVSFQGYSNLIPICLEPDGSDTTDLSVDIGITIGLWDPYGYIYCEETGEILKDGLITITGPEGAVIHVLADGSDGFYRFETNISGDYQISYSHPDGYEVSIANPPIIQPSGNINLLDGTSVDKDGIVNGIIRLGSLSNSDTTFLLNPDPSYNVYILEGYVEIGIPWLSENNLPINCHPGEISGVLWKDENNNGARDSLESLLANVLVFLYSVDTTDGSITAIDSAFTNSSGVYTFSVLPFGEYVIELREEDFPDEDCSYSLKQNMAPDNIDSDVDPLTGLISGIVVNKDNPVLQNNGIGLFLELCSQQCIPIFIKRLTSN